MLMGRYDLDEPSELSRKFVVHVSSTLKDLQEREDTDGDWQITIDDHGPKVRLPEPHHCWLH
jgi:Neutral trehalase Ca2+ binding domain